MIREHEDEAVKGRFMWRNVSGVLVIKRKIFMSKLYFLSPLLLAAQVAMLTLNQTVDFFCSIISILGSDTHLFTHYKTYLSILFFYMVVCNRIKLSSVFTEVLW